MAGPGGPVTPITQGQVEELLADHAELLATDGYRLHIDVDGAAVRLRVEATPEACAECLVPQSLMEDMLRHALSEGDPHAARREIALSYPSG